MSLPFCLITSSTIWCRFKICKFCPIKYPYNIRHLRKVKVFVHGLTYCPLRTTGSEWYTFKNGHVNRTSKYMNDAKIMGSYYYFILSTSFIDCDCLALVLKVLGFSNDLLCVLEVTNQSRFMWNLKLLRSNVKRNKPIALPDNVFDPVFLLLELCVMYN